MRRRREKQPFVRAGDKILIRSGGGMGTWDVLAARYANLDPYDEKISLVLGRGSTTFKTDYDPRRMEHKCDVPPHKLHRNIRKAKSIRFKP